jgi:hypothetical protein
MTSCARARSSTLEFPTRQPGSWRKSNTLAELRGWTRYVGLQIEYSLLECAVERELVPMARRRVREGSRLNGVLPKYTAKLCS